MHPRPHIFRRLLSAMFVALLATPLFDGDAARATAAPAPGIDELLSMTYAGLEGDSAVTLADGQWEGAPFVEGSAVRPYVRLIRRFRLTGDLDMDGDDEAVVFLSEGLGGSGEFKYVAVVDRVDGSVKNIATAPLGDQVQVRDASIAKGRLVLDVIQVGEPDPRCCPGDWLTRTFVLGPKGLQEETSKSKPKRLSPEALGGGPWRLRSWDADEPLPDSVDVTLALEGTVLVGEVGCNRYAVPYKAGEIAGEIRLGEIQETRTACPDSALSLETRYLDLLGRVRKFAFEATELIVTWEKAKRYGTLVFARKPGP